MYAYVTGGFVMIQYQGSNVCDLWYETVFAPIHHAKICVKQCHDVHDWY